MNDAQAGSIVSAIKGMACLGCFFLLLVTLPIVAALHKIADSIDKHRE